MLTEWSVDSLLFIHHGVTYFFRFHLLRKVKKTIMAICWFTDLNTIPYTLFLCRVPRINLQENRLMQNDHHSENVKITLQQNILYKRVKIYLSMSSVVIRSLVLKWNHVGSNPSHCGWFFATSSRTLEIHTTLMGTSPMYKHQSRKLKAVYA